MRGSDEVTKTTEPFPKMDPNILPEQHTDPHDRRLLQRRSKPSYLRGDLRGDTAAPALATLYDQASPPPSSEEQSQKPARQVNRSKRKRVKSAFRRWKSFSLRHTWFNPLVVCLTVLLIYLSNPSRSNIVYPALFISYPMEPSPDSEGSRLVQYSKGRNDFIFVGFYTIFLSFTREFTMQCFLRPLATRYGILSRGKQARFMEQAYTAIYFATFGPFGIYVMKQSKLWYFNTEAMYEGFPHMTITAIFKTYYLLQAAYWVQQMIVLLLMLEKPRKDFKELVAHHFITIALIWCSYRFHFTNMGLPVFITHDVSDFTLAVLNYVDSPLVIPYFILFLSSWIYLRHWQNLRILFSILPLHPLPLPMLNTFFSNVYKIILSFVQPVLNITCRISPALGAVLARAVHGPYPPSQFATIGPFELDWEGQQYKSSISQWITFFLLAALQAVNLFWLWLILKILARVVRSLGQDARDDRSVCDSDEEEEQSVKSTNTKPGRIDHVDTMPDEDDEKVL